MIHKNQ